ncbi:hypothetical protein CHUAL_013216 [Chamberlinius hualienensis]
MGKRKPNNPVKIDDETRSQLTWNLRDSSTSAKRSVEEENGLDHGSVVNVELDDRLNAVDTTDDNSISQLQQLQKTKFSSSKRRRKGKLDDNLQSLIDDCDFYLKANCSGNGADRDVVGEIGSFNLRFVNRNLTELPCASQCWIYVSQIPDRSMLYYEWHELSSSSKNSKTERQMKYFPLNLLETSYELLRALRKRKSISLDIDTSDITTNTITVRVILMTGGLLDLHDLHVVLGGIRNDVQTVMKYLCGISTTDYSGMELKRHQNVNDLYEEVLKIHRFEEKREKLGVQHSGLVPQLRPYQVEAVRWMLEKEKYNARETDTFKSQVLHPLFEEIKLKNGITVFYNRFGGMFVRTKPLKQPTSPGGILADEMGLGKTIEVLACILCHPRPANPISQLSPALSYSKPFSDDKSTENVTSSYFETSVKAKPYFECVCGEYENEKDDETTVQCIKCGLWQHSECVKYEPNDRNDRYLCPHCTITEPPILSRATLIVSPASIIHQWVEEIHRHIHSKSLRLLIYTGVQSMGFVQPSSLADNDVVLMTYATLRKEFSFVDLPHTNSENRRRFRHPKRFMAIPTPLVAVEWWRICLDEAQMVESPTAKTAEMALRLSSINRWCITGTPIQKSVNDLYGLLLFLGLDPYCVQLWWKECLLRPYQNGDQKLLQNVIATVLWRTAKKDVLDQINIPSQNECLHWLSFTPVEEHFYRMQHVECSRDMVSQLNHFTDDSLRLNTLDRQELSKLLTPFLKLRQACCHPQVVRGHMLPIHRNALTMEQLLESLIKKAKMDSERAHRGLVASLNGLAAIYIIKEEWSEAVEKYREVLRSIEELRPKIKTDKLQRIHTLHNLHEVLSAGHENIPPTLRDSSLLEEEKKIERAFLEKFKQKVLDSRTVLNSTSVAVVEHREKMDHKNSWWLNILNWAHSTDRSADILQRVHNELLDNSHSKAIGTTIKNKFRDVNGLSYVITNNLDALYTAHEKLNEAVQKLENDPSQEVIRSTVECHLRVSKKKVPKCIYCQVDNFFNKYESRLYSITEERFGGEPDEDEQNLLGPLRRGNWADSETEKSLKAILAFGKNVNVNRTWIEGGQLQLKYFELLKKDFRGLRGVWMQLRDQASAIDELSQATIRLSVRYDDDESNNDASKSGTIAHYEVEQHRTQLLSSVIVERNEMQKKLGQLHYLTNLSTSDYGRRGGTNPDPCPICQHPLGEKWTVLVCGHCFCMECFQVLVSNVCRFGHRWKLKCPVCRQVTRDIETSYVSTKSEELLDDEIEIKGSHSTKVEAVIRQLLKIKQEDPTAKSILFSTWQNVLDVLMPALTENSIAFTFIATGKKLQKNMNRFKSDPNTNVLLLLVQSGANGLNIIEATHVLLVEPILNPASELQAIGRIHRIGQTKQTFIHKFIVRGTIEERMHNSTRLHSEYTSGHYTTDENTITLGTLKDLFLEEPEQENAST